MCGIAGYLVRNPLPNDILEEMVEALVHRGPDSSGFCHDHPYHAGMRRLSINDLTGGNQPLVSQDESVQLLYNGEIYNSPALRKELEADGAVFRTHSDGEVICHLYERVGLKTFELLDGMFAVALWDSPRKRLILARDIPGEKPLYYAPLEPGELVFSSELKSLVKHPAVSRRLNLQALWDFPTFLWIPEPDTVYEGVYALPPAHILVIEDNRTNLIPFTNRQYNFDPPRNENEVIEQTRMLVEEAVRSRLLSDVPVGSFLSSGLDSSIVATLAARHRNDLATFTIGFEDVDDPYHGNADESPHVERYAKQLGTNHHTIHVTANDFLRDLELFTFYGDQPFAVSSGLGILAIARAAREHGVAVLLSGDGADEVFGGYSWYTLLTSPEMNGGSANGWIEPQISMQYANLPHTEVLKALASYRPAHRAWAWHYYASEHDKKSIFATEPFKDVASSLRHFERFRNDSHWRPEDYIRHDRLFYFPNEMLRKVDRMTMAMSVEGRVPLAAPSLLAFANTLRYSDMVRGNTLKWALRRAFTDLLPQEVVERPKHGFNVPIDHWLKGRWAGLLSEAFAPSSALSRLGLIRPNAENAAQKLLDDPLLLSGHTLFCYIQLNRWLECNEVVI